MTSLSKNDIEFISFNKGGSMYVAYKIKNVKNNINTKAKPRNELLIIGIPAKKVFKWLDENNFTIFEFISKLENKEQQNE